MGEISQQLASQLGGVSNTVYLDSKYKTESYDFIKSIIEENTIDSEMYVSEYFDCDDFAVSLFGHFKSSKRTSAIPFGLCFVGTSGGGGHAINVFYADDGLFYLVEPQSDDIWKFGEKHSDYDPYFLMI